MSYFDKLMAKVRRDKKELAKSYKTTESSIIYMGDNKYIVLLPNGKEVRI